MTSDFLKKQQLANSPTLMSDREVVDSHVNLKKKGLRVPP